MKMNFCTHRNSSAGASGALRLYILDIFKSKCGLACQTVDDPPFVGDVNSSCESIEIVGGRPFRLLEGDGPSTGL